MCSSRCGCWDIDGDRNATVLALIPGTALAPGRWRTVGPIALGGGLLTLLAFVVQSSGEEVLFRGWLFGGIGLAIAHGSAS